MSDLGYVDVRNIIRSDKKLQSLFKQAVAYYIAEDDLICDLGAKRRDPPNIDKFPTDIGHTLFTEAITILATPIDDKGKFNDIWGVGDKRHKGIFDDKVDRMTEHYAQTSVMAWVAYEFGKQKEISDFSDFAKTHLSEKVKASYRRAHPILGSISRIASKIRYEITNW